MDVMSLVVEPKLEGDYVVWLQLHPHGFVINVRAPGENAMYWHRADCGHIQPDGQSRLVEGVRIKACSVNPGALAVWAKLRRETLHYCQTCHDKWIQEVHSVNVRKL